MTRTDPTERAAFRARRAVEAAWDAEHPSTLDRLLHFVEELRQLFGDPEIDRRPTRGSDFRLA